MNKENLTALLSSSSSHSLQASQNTDLKMSIALTAARKMLKSDRFDICTVRDICQIIGANADGPAFDMLRTLHCFHYSEIPRDVLDAIPALMREVFSKTKMDDSLINDVFQEGGAA